MNELAVKTMNRKNEPIQGVSPKVISNKNHSSSEKPSSLLKKAYERLLKIRDRPKEIALGFALGIFIGMSPTMGFQMAIAVPIASLLKWNKISSAIGVWISNPLTAPVIYTITYILGAKILGLKGQENVMEMIGLLSQVPGIIWSAIFGQLQNGPDFWTTLMAILSKTSLFLIAATVGGVIIGLPLSILGYLFLFSAVDKYQEEIKMKLAEKKVRLTKRKIGRKIRKQQKKK